MDVSILIGNVIIPTDFHSIICQRDGEKPPTSSCRLSLPHLAADTPCGSLWLGRFGCDVGMGALCRNLSTELVICHSYGTHKKSPFLMGKSTISKRPIFIAMANWPSSGQTLGKPFGWWVSQMAPCGSFPHASIRPDIVTRQLLDHVHHMSANIFKSVRGPQHSGADALTPVGVRIRHHSTQFDMIRGGFCMFWLNMVRNES